MNLDRVEPFPDNWTYLRAELHWLDRLLSLAVARQRKDTKDIDRVSRSRADRVTSHWWKGLISLDGEIAYDSPADDRRKSSPTKGTYQQQLEAKIQASQKRGIWLGLPALCQQLQLTGFEKNLVLMALAPEINRRYGRMYHYLQEAEQPSATELPTVDLILRIFCRTDAEWKAARQTLTTGSILVQHGLVELLALEVAPLLARSVKLSDTFVNYLLAEQPSSLAVHLRPASSVTATATPQITYLQTWNSPPSSTSAWSELVLPSTLLKQLQHLCDRMQFAQLVDEDWGFQASAATFLQPVAPLGSIVLLVGEKGTGKTTAARAIAQTLQCPLSFADLALLPPSDFPQLLQEIGQQTPTVLLLKSAQCWFGRAAMLSETEIIQFLDQQRRAGGITLLSVQPCQPIKPRWRQQLHAKLEFAVPDATARLRLWQQAIPAQVPITEINWQWLAHQFVLTGGAIRTIAWEAAIDATSQGQPLGINHLIRACQPGKPRKGL